MYVKTKPKSSNNEYSQINVFHLNKKSILKAVCK